MILTGPEISVGHLTPSYTHMAIAELMKSDKVKAVITENTDNFHRMSGMPVGNEVFKKLYEIHGNEYVQTCTKCSLEYSRDS